jgi:ABC-type lipoprotein export system ATPase subunit
VTVVPMLELDSGSRSFWRGTHEIPVLKDVSLEVAAGDLVAVYGRRNAGKTTLLKVAAGFERLDRGRVVFEGKDLSRLSRKALTRLHRERIAWMERSGPHSRELPTSVYVALPLYGKVGPVQAQRLAVTALKRVGAEECADERWGDLPDTARVLVAIAHALVREPSLIVADDPTAGLGIVDRERVVGLLRSAADEGGVGILMAVPDMPAMLQAHQVRSLSRGRLLAPAGSHQPDDGNVVALPRRTRSA